MISAKDIRSRARELGVLETTIERDYAQNWLLKHLASIEMALKGGTGIRKAYIKNYRFSDDLDSRRPKRGLCKRMDKLASTPVQDASRLRYCVR